MSSPHRPRFVKQLDGSRYGGLNCTMAATAMAIDRHTLGQKRYTAAYLRSLTGDTAGGTNLAQADSVATRLGAPLDIEYGLPIARFDAMLRAGQGAVVQGASSATRGTIYSASETFGGNHAWYVNEGRGWRLVGSTWVPTDYLVYDPLADGRRAGIARSPFWLPRAYFLRFCERLNIGGRLLGPGRVYAGFTRDTEPHVHIRYGAARTVPFPDRTRANRPLVQLYTGPNTSYPKAALVPKDEVFVAWQVASGGTVAGSTSRRWYGDHNGTRWAHASHLRRTGGTT